MEEKQQVTKGPTTRSKAKEISERVKVLNVTIPELEVAKEKIKSENPTEKFVKAAIEPQLDNGEYINAVFVGVGLSILFVILVWILASIPVPLKKH